MNAYTHNFLFPHHGGEPRSHTLTWFLFSPPRGRATNASTYTHTRIFFPHFGGSCCLPPCAFCSHFRKGATPKPPMTTATYSYAPPSCLSGRGAKPTLPPASVACLREPLTLKSVSVAISTPPLQEGATPTPFFLGGPRLTSTGNRCLHMKIASCRFAPPACLTGRDHASTPGGDHAHAFLIQGSLPMPLPAAVACRLPRRGAHLRLPSSGRPLHLHGQPLPATARLPPIKAQ